MLDSLDINWLYLKISSEVKFEILSDLPILTHTSFIGYFDKFEAGRSRKKLKFQKSMVAFFELIYFRQSRKAIINLHVLNI